MKTRQYEHLNGKDGHSAFARICKTSSLTLVK